MKKRQNSISNKLNGIHLFLAVTAMFFLVIAILLSSFQIAIYGDSDYGFYRKEYEKYEVTAPLNMGIDDVMEVTEHMMDYLIGKTPELSIETNVDGRKQDFFNEQDRLHMSDVKNLFLGGLKLRNILAILVVLLLVILLIKKADVRSLLLRAYGIAMAVFVLLLFFLGVAFAIDFTKCFTIFHEIFFTNDLWMFDPETDYMIRMLPEGFFFDMAIRIGEVFIGLLAVLGVVTLILKQCGKKNYTK